MERERQCTSTDMCEPPRKRFLNCNKLLITHSIYSQMTCLFQIVRNLQRINRRFENVVVQHKYSSSLCPICRTVVNVLRKKIKLQQHHFLFLCKNKSNGNRNGSSPHMGAVCMCVRHAALFYRCVLLNAFKELFTAKYLCLCTFFKYCVRVYEFVCLGWRNDGCTLSSTFLCSLNNVYASECVSTMPPTPSLAFDSRRHSHCRFQTITMFHSIFVHTNPCPVISTIHVILLYFVCVIHNLFSSSGAVFTHPFPFPVAPQCLCTSVSCAVANDVGNTFYVDVNSLNCPANGSLFAFSLKHIDSIDIMEAISCKSSAFQNDDKNAEARTEEL